MEERKRMPRQRKTKAGAALRRWFKEEWVDISTKKKGKHPPCGRKSAKGGEGRSYPKCRPKKKVSSKTPRTAGSLSSSKKRSLSAEKKAAGKKRAKTTLKTKRSKK